MNALDEILLYARKTKASDVHLSYDSIILRNQGKLIPYYLQYNPQDIENMILTMLDDKQKQKLKDNKDLDFIYKVGTNRHRVNVYKEQEHLTAAIRIIFEEIRSIEELGLPPVLKKLTNEPRGLIIVTGPTGSGKSTTLAAMIDAINTNRNCHILTIEDPIEYVYQRKQALIHQREIENDVESFNIALRSAMREDPDVILVGEMRDYETIQAVMTLAETGHLVFSTLHTIGAAKTIDRIIDVFPPHSKQQIRTQLSGILTAVVTQQLLPKLNQTGRVAAFEVMVVNDAIRNLIRENKEHQINSIIQTGRQQGNITLNASLLELVNKHLISKDQAIKYSDNVSELKDFL